MVLECCRHNGADDAIESPSTSPAASPMFGSTARTNATRSITRSSPAIADAGERLKSAPGSASSCCRAKASRSAQGSTSRCSAMAERRAPSRHDAAIRGARARESGHHPPRPAGRWVWQELAVPVIAAVHGHALGGGLQIALGADIRYVHPDTQLSVREVHWGLVPDMTGTLFLSRSRRHRRRQGARLHRPDLRRQRGQGARHRDPPERGSARGRDGPRRRDRRPESRTPCAAPSALINRLAIADAGEQFAAEREEIGALVGRPTRSKR